MKNEKKNASVHYTEYLQLNKVLDAQDLKSAEAGKPAHEEMLFIIIHQVYELWFKQVLHEMESVASMFKTDSIDERNIGIAVSRLDRVIEIQQVMIDQVRVLETMTPLDFLDFRNYLTPASGFQSFQFRKLEILLGLKRKDRLTYNQKVYSSVFSESEQLLLEQMESDLSMMDLVEKWLERTPFLVFGNFDFLKEYRHAVKNMLDKDKAYIDESAYIGEAEKAMRMKMITGTETYFEEVLDEARHSKAQEDGTLRMSYKATIAALLINLYRDEPILRMPYELLRKLVDVDERFTTWRYRHSQMVLRMLGRKMGTGGSSGHDYLKSTTEKHHVFRDLYNISTLLIPRSELPVLPEQLKKELGFYFTTK